MSVCVWRGLGKASSYVECLSHPPPPVISTPRVKQSWADTLIPLTLLKTHSMSLRYSSLSCLFSSAADKVRAVGLVAMWAACGGHTVAGLPTSVPFPRWHPRLLRGTHPASSAAPSRSVSGTWFFPCCPLSFPFFSCSCSPTEATGHIPQALEPICLSLFPGFQRMTGARPPVMQERLLPSLI